MPLSSAGNTLEGCLYQLNQLPFCAVPYISHKKSCALLPSMQVRAVFSADPDLLDWVTSMPDNATVERVRACAEQLALCAAQAAEGGASGALLNDAYSILHMLCQTPVSLRWVCCRALRLRVCMQVCACLQTVLLQTMLCVCGVACCPGRQTETAPC
jgi:hypothetical protein